MTTGQSGGTALRMRTNPARPDESMKLTLAGPHSRRQDFLAPMIVAGLGMGGTFAPLTHGGDA